MWFNLAVRLFKHELRRGELTIILAAIVLSVASVFSLSLFSARLQAALTDQSAAFIASDRQLSSGRQLNPDWLQQAIEMGLQTAQQISTRSMLFAGESMVLADIKAVSNEYPLKGKVKVADQPFEIGAETGELPQPGHIWMDSRLFQQLELSIGDQVEIGESQFLVSKALVDVPDRGFAVFGNDQLVLMSYQDILATGLVGPGARINYRYFYAGDRQQLDAYYEWLAPQLVRERHRWRSVEDDDSAIGNAVKRAERFFLLASLLAIVLAAVAIAVAAQRYSQRHFDPVAIMKTLGASRGLVQRVYLMQMALVTLVAIVTGLIAGYAIQQGIVGLVAERVPVALDGWHWQPVWTAIMTGVVCAFLFSVYPLLRLFSIPPLRVLRRDLGEKASRQFGQFMLAGAAIFSLMWIFSRDLKISAILFVTGAVLIAALFAVSFGLIKVGRWFGSGKIGPWQLAWARIQRRAMNNSVQLISFSVTLLLLLVVLVMRNDMVQQWRDQLPQGTPNYFVINISESQLPKLKQQFDDYQVDAGQIYPLIRGRLAAIGGERVRSAVSKEGEQTQNEGRAGMGREANLTWSDSLQKGNKIVAGRFFDDTLSELPEVSVEQQIAERLNINLGDTLEFDIGGQPVVAKVTSLREVDWQTMQPNFFFVLQPAAMEGFPATYITSFFLDEQRKAELTQILSPLASVSLIDVDARINQVREIIDQVSLAVEFILILVLCAGSLVLIAQVQASMDERVQELAILRTLGAKGWLIRTSVVGEFVIIGAVAGVMAALANELALYLLQSQVFNMPASLHFEYWLTAPIVGAAVVSILGAISCWRLLRINTAQLLRTML